MENLSRETLMDLSTESLIGLIYSRSELSQYLVELIAFKRADYIHEGDEIATFSTIDEALRSAQKQGANCFFLCLDTTDDECGTGEFERRFNYLPVYPNKDI